ncbi:MAG TPA: TolC family protein [Edaphobacter sp.]|nr:TolC family protein [Edaphobacter sp.]
MRRKQTLLYFLFMLLAKSQAIGQAVSAPSQILTIDLPDALARARQYGSQLQSANIAAALLREDRVQAKAATLPSLNAFNQFIYTQGNGTPSGVFVANNGIHVYNEQAQVHEELLSFLRRGEVRLAAVNEAAAKARVEVAARGLQVTVVQDYYAIASAQRKDRNAQLNLREAQNFLDITQKQERGGEVPHSDVIKAQLQVQQRQREMADTQLAVKKAKVMLAVLIFPSLQLSYDVVDDLSKPAILPDLAEVSGQATASSPDLHTARLNLSAANLGVSVARHAYLPSLSLDFFYGIDANQFAATSHNVPADERSNLPNFTVDNRNNLGYSAEATLTIPVWTWGSIHSKVKQAALKKSQAALDLTVAQKQLQADLASAYSEAETAFGQLESLRSSAELSAESLRLTLLRYQAGEATALEVVDAQVTASQGRGAYDDGLVRYRVALATLQSLTGTL